MLYMSTDPARLDRFVRTPETRYPFLTRARLRIIERAYVEHVAELYDVGIAEALRLIISEAIVALPKGERAELERGATALAVAIDRTVPPDADPEPRPLPPRAPVRRTPSLRIVAAGRKARNN